MKCLYAVLIAGMLAIPGYAQLAPFDANGITYGHVHMNVPDLEVHKKILVEQFGGVVIIKGPLTVVKFPSLLIALAKKEATGPSEGTTMDHVGFKVKDLPAHLAKWRAAGFMVGREFIGTEGFPNAYIFGPDNVKLELQEDTTMNVDVMGYHVHTYSTDYVKMLDWYADTFSLPKRPRGKVMTTAQAPGMNMTFETAMAPVVGTKGRTIDHIGFEIKDLKAFCAKLEARGIKFDVPYREVPAIGLKIAYITDPWGTYIELTEGYDKY